MAVGIGCLGIWYGNTHGFAEPLTPQSMLPDFSDGNALTYLSIIIYNYMRSSFCPSLVAAVAVGAWVERSCS